MVSHPGAGGVRPLLKLLEVQALRGAADRDLLRRFAAAADEAAFRVIAERHGPMVLGVCARLLGNRHDAEDALQATFLVLARRAAAVRNSESLASWLHGVARRVSARLRRADRRRAAREQAVASPDARAPADDPAWAEVRAGLDEELGRLPAAYREVLVLCYLERLTRDEAGRRLGIEPGAVKGRLERGRRLLGERLVRRGIGLSAGLAGLAVAPPATAAVHLGRLAADPAAASPRAVALTHEFLKGVAMTKLKFVTAGLAGVLVLAVGVGTAQQTTPPVPQPDGGTVLGRKLGEKVPPAAADTDEAFIRRVSLDLRGTEPSFAELHFFLTSKEPNKRAVLVDLFVKDRSAKGTAQQLGEKDAEKLYRSATDRLAQQRALEALSREQAAQAERAAAQDRAAWAERMAKLGYLGQAQAEAERARAAAEAERAAVLRDAALKAQVEEQARRAAEAQARAERERATAEKAVYEARLRHAFDELEREATKRKGPQKGARDPNDPNRPTPPPPPIDPTARPAPPPPPIDPTGRPTSKATPPAVPAPPAPIVTSPNRNTVPATPLPTAIAAPAPAPAPAANVEVLRVRVQLAEVTLREKTLNLQNTENLFKNKVISSRELDLAKLEVERAQLQLREAQLALDAAARPAEPRPIPPSPARP